MNNDVLYCIYSSTSSQYSHALSHWMPARPCSAIVPWSCRQHKLDLAPLLDCSLDTSKFHKPLFAAVIYGCAAFRALFPFG